MVKASHDRKKQEFRVRKRCAAGGGDSQRIAQEVDDQLRRAEHYLKTGVVLSLES